MTAHSAQNKVNRITQHSNTMPDNNIEIIAYAKEYKDFIKALNYEWLNKYFRVEPNDVIQLSDPDGEIVAKGGLIYFAAIDGQIVGTASLLKIDDKTYELGKMAVTEKYQGMGIGRKLLEFCIEKAKNIGTEKLILFSNTRLVPAIELYQKYGFVESALDPGHYERANIKMELHLKA